MATMARSFPCPKPLAATVANASGDRHFQISLSPRRIARSTRTTLQRGRSVLVSVATEASSKYPTNSSANRDAKISGSNPPTEVDSSTLCIQIPNELPTWSTWLVGAAVVLSVPLYRRIIRSEVIKEKAEEAAEKAIRAMDKVADEAGKIAAEVKEKAEEAETSSKGKIKQVALKIEGIAKRIERDAEEEVKHIKEEVEELLEPIVEAIDAKEREENQEKDNRSINDCEEHGSGI